MSAVVYTTTRGDTVRVVVYHFHTAVEAAMGYVRASDEEAEKIIAACSLLTPIWAVSGCAAHLLSVDEFLSVIGARG